MQNIDLETKLDDALKKIVESQKEQKHTGVEKWQFYLSLIIFIFGMFGNIWIFSAKITSMDNQISFSKELILNHITTNDIHISHDFSHKVNTSYSFIMEADKLCTRTEMIEINRRLDNLEKK